MGLSRVLLDTHLTASSVRAFTWDYASPEQIAGAPLSLASDVFSLGVSCQASSHEGRAQMLLRWTQSARVSSICEARTMLRSAFLSLGFAPAMDT